MGGSPCFYAAFLSRKLITRGTGVPLLVVMLETNLLHCPKNLDVPRTLASVPLTTKCSDDSLCFRDFSCRTESKSNWEALPVWDKGWDIV